MIDRMSAALIVLLLCWGLLGCAVSPNLAAEFDVVIRNTGLD
jgi:hypothetical protein